MPLEQSGTGPSFPKSTRGLSTHVEIKIEGSSSLARKRLIWSQKTLVLSPSLTTNPRSNLGFKPFSLSRSVGLSVSWTLALAVLTLFQLPAIRNSLLSCQYSNVRKKRNQIKWVRVPRQKYIYSGEEKGKWTLTQQSTAPDLGTEVSAGKAWGGTARLPAPAGGGVEVLACIVPGREPCFFFPGTPRWRPGTRSPSRRKPRGLERQAEADRGRGSGAGKPVSAAAASESTRTGET